jgi:hypothetical protein
MPRPLFAHAKATRRRATSPGSAITREFEVFTNPLFTNKPKREQDGQAP